MKQYIEPTALLDSHHPAVEHFVARHAPAGTPTERAVALYYAVRDSFWYDPFVIELSPARMRTSLLFESLNTAPRPSGHCAAKAAALAAAGRAAEIPTRLGYAIVRNHIGLGRMGEALRTDLIVCHGYTELYLNEKWVKATPAFNAALCEKLGVPALPFDGQEDAIFQAYGADGSSFMEYLHDYGTFADVPVPLLRRELQKHYPHFFENLSEDQRIDMTQLRTTQIPDDRS